MSTLVHLIRHGVTTSNVRQIYMGRSEESLSNDGRWQARQIARRLRDVDLEAIYCSPLQRARETAEILSQPHATVARIDEDINEIDLSRWQGKPAEEIRAADPEAWQQWCDDPSDLVLEGIEPLPDLARRVRSFLARSRRQHPEAGIAAITHDAVIRVAVIEAIAVPLRLYRSLPVHNATLTVIELGEPRNHLRLFNDSGHLDGVGHVSGPADR